MSTKRTIKVKNYLNIFEEFEAAAAITPGMLVKQTSATEVAVHSTEDGNAIPMFAIEDELQGKEKTEAYAHEDRVQVWIPQRGDIVNAIAEDGEDIAVGDFVTSAGNGKVKKYVAVEFGDSPSDAGVVNPLSIIGQAVEAKDMSGSSGVDPDPYIEIRIV